MDIDELFEIKPKIGGKQRSNIHTPFKSALLRRSSFGLSKRPSTGKMFNIRGGRHDRGALSSFVKPPGQFARRVVIKGHFVKMNEYGKKAASLHVNYLEREGVEKNGDKGILYGEDNFDRDNFLKEIKNEPHQFRFVISPEDAHDLDLTDYTKKLMTKMQQDIGRSIEWSAVNHYNTNDPHTHVIVRGIDLDGKTLFIDRNYMSYGFRNRAINIATEELGLRSEYDINKQIEREINQERFTQLDQKIFNLTGSDHRINIGNYPKTNHERIYRGNLISRLENLEKLGVAVKLNNNEWQLKEGWNYTLKDLSNRNDIIKTMYQAIGNKSRYYHIYKDNNISKPIEGKLIKKSITDYDNYYFVVETTTGEANYIEIKDIREFEKYKENDVIKIDVKQEKWLKSSDLNILEQTNSNGVYNAEQHKKAIGTPTVKLKNGRTVKTHDFVNSHVQRLDKLRRLGLAQLNQDGSWTVSKNIVEVLNKKDIETPLKNINISRETDLKLKDQIKYKGRTWLDRFTDDSDKSHLYRSGFGAEVKKLSKIRAQYLLTLGIDPNDPARAKKLDLIEKEELQKTIKDNTSYNFNDSKTLTGRIEKIEMQSGKKHAYIISERTREFSLVPWKDSYERMKDVTVNFEKGKPPYLTKFDRDLGR